MLNPKKSHVLDQYAHGNITAVPYGAEIRTKEERERQKKRLEILAQRGMDERGSFVIVNLEYLRTKLTEVGYVDIGYAMMLLPLARYMEEGESFLRLGTEAEPATYEVISEIWNLKPDTVRKLIKKLVDKGILIVATDKLDKRKKVVYFSKDFAVKGGKPKIYNMYTKVYQFQLEIALALMPVKAEKAKAMGVFALCLIKFNGNTQILLEDEEKATVMLKKENIVDFFNRLRIAGKNATTILSMKNFLGISDNRGIKKSLCLLQEVGMLTQVQIDKKKVYMVNPACASKRDSSQLEMYYFVLRNFFEHALVSKLLLYKTITVDKEIE